MFDDEPDDASEIAEMFTAYATAETGGLCLHDYTCLALSARSDAYEHERRRRRIADAAFRVDERARWKRANANRIAKRKAAREAAKRTAEVHPAPGRCPALTSQPPPSPPS